MYFGAKVEMFLTKIDVDKQEDLFFKKNIFSFYVELSLGIKKRFKFMLMFVC